jgi:lipid-A-disaccharide synthase
MRSSGIELLEDTSRLGIFGFWEGLGSYPRMHDFLRRMKDHLSAARPDVFVPVSYSGVNLPLACHARRLGIKVIYISPPQLWAWGHWRARTLRQSADKVICLLPFEEPFFKSLGVKAMYLGNPLADLLDPYRISQAERGVGSRPAEHGASRSLILMPGSRTAELRHHRRLLLLVAEQLSEEIPGLAVQEVTLPETAGQGRYRLMARADLIIAASGTATLEAAILRVPLIAIYRLSTISYLLARVLVRLRHFSLPNIIGNTGSVPEFLQPDAGQIVACARELLTSTEKRQGLSDELARIRALLGPSGAARRIAEQILE